MRRSRSSIWVVLGCLMASVLAIQAGTRTRRPARLTIQQMTAAETTAVAPDGTTTTRRAFRNAVPYEEYLAALAAERDSTQDISQIEEPPFEPDPGGNSVAACTPPDDDYDGDGFTLSTPIQDAFPLRQGEYVADRPMVTSGFDSITPGVDYQLTGTIYNYSEDYTFFKDDLVHVNEVKQTREFKKHFKTGFAIKRLFGFGAAVVPFFSLELSAEGNAERNQTYNWTDTKTRTVQTTFTNTKRRIASSEITVGPTAGHVRGFAVMKNSSDYNVRMRVSDIHIGVVATNPFTGEKAALGEEVIAGPLLLNFGAGIDTVTRFVDVDQLNSNDMLRLLSEGWVFDLEVSGGFGAVDADTGTDVGFLMSRINERNARLAIHYGDASARESGQVSVFQPAGACLTARDLLIQYVGAANVEFERVDGVLHVKRIHHRTNRWTNQDFDTLTTEQQGEFGRWVVGYEYHIPSAAPFDLETTLLRTEDRVKFYFITETDFRDVLAAANEDLGFQVANDGSSPSEMVAAPSIKTNDLVEVTVSNRFQIEEAYTQFIGNGPIGTPCGNMFQVTFHGRRVAVDSLNNTITIPNADYYGVQVKLGGQPWLTVAQVMANATAQAKLLAFRGFPNYDYVLQFRASPSLMGGYPERNLQIRTVKPRQSFTVGFQGRDVLSRPMTCYHTEIGGYFRSSGSARIWYQLDTNDSDLDGYTAQTATGNDFDDANARRFRTAPEHLDGLDNDGDNTADNHPARCPARLQSYELGTCTLDDAMGWYGAGNPNTLWERRWRLAGGASTAWETVGSGIRSYSFTMSSDAAHQFMELKITYYPPGGGTFFGSNLIEHEPGGTIPVFSVGQEIQAEAGQIFAPFRIDTAGPDTYVHVPAGTQNTTGASAEYRLQVTQTGDYQIWTRVYATNSGDDSFLVRMLNGAGQPVNFGFGASAHYRLEWTDPYYAHGSFGWTRVGHWNPYVTPEEVAIPITYRLTPGTYTVQFLPRELGTRLDKLRMDRFCPDADADGWTTCAGDCNDSNPNVRPGRGEVCNNGIDDDCDGYVNEGCYPPPPCIKYCLPEETEL